VGPHHPSRTPVAIGFITLFFGVGQFISPAINGYLVDQTNSYFYPFLLSALICLSGGLGCVMLHLRGNTVKRSSKQSA
jgi:MFS family permease